MKRYPTLKKVPRYAAMAAMASLPTLSFAQADNDEEEAFFELSPFTVDGSTDDGYRGTHSLAGTRIKSNLRDVASSIAVITKEMLEDTAVNDINDLMVYTANGESGGNNGNFTGVQVGGDNVGADAGVRARPQTNLRVRGLDAPDLTRNYFLTDMWFDGYNTSRVEVNRGANAILFGLGSPAGVVNNGLLAPVFGDLDTTVKLRVGQHGSFRGEFDHNQQIIEDKFAVRVAGLVDNKSYKQDPAFQDQQRLFLTGTWRVDERTNFKFNAETVDIDANRPSVIAPTDWISGWILAGKPLHDASFYGKEGDTPRNPDGTWYEANPAGIELDLGMGLVVNSSDATDLVRFSHPGFFEKSYAQVHTQPNLADPDFSLGMIPFGNFPTADGFDDHPLLPDGLEPAAYLYKNTTGLREMYGGQGSGVDHQGLNDTRLFDWVNNMIGGDTAFQHEDFEAFNVSVDRTFLADRSLAVELAYDTQDYASDAFSPFQDQWSGISIDVNPYLPFGVVDGEPQMLVENPNYLRPYVFSRNNRRRIYETTRESSRATVNYELRLGEKMKSDFMASLLGTHNFTALLNRQEIQKDSYTLDLHQTDEFFSRISGQPLGSGFDPQISHTVYIGPAVDPSAINNIYDVQIQALDGVEIWNTDRTFETVIWDPGVKPGSDGAVAVGTEAADAQEILDVAGPDGTGSIRTITTRSGAYVDSPNKTFETIDTQAISLQSRLLGDNMIVTYGLREDTLGLRQAGAGDFARDEFDAYLFDSVDINNVEERERVVDTTTWGVVGYLPDSILELPGDATLSFHYGESENFRPELGRIDHVGNTLPDPGGETKEYGFALTAMENKLSMRVNWYETNLVNASTWLSVNEAVNGWVQRNGALWRDALALKDHADPVKAAGYEFGIAAAEAWFNTIPSDFAETWNVRKIYDENGNVTDVQKSDPAGVTDMEDRSSEGIEIEMVFNPTQSWRIAANLSKQFTTATNVRPVSRTWAEQLEATLATPIPGYDGLFVGDVPEWGIRKYDPTKEGTRRFVDWNSPTIAQWSDARALKPVRDSLALEGTQSAYQREWRFNLITNYKFREGKLRGFGLGGAYRYESEAIIDYPFTTNENGDSIADIENAFTDGDRNNFDLWFSYDRMLGDNVDWNVQLNIRNLTGDSDDFIPISYHLGGPLAGEVSRVRYAPQREIYLTNTFKF